MSGRIAALHRFPVKGLSPERLSSAMLETGRYFPGDRLFAIENGPSGYDEAAPRHFPKIAFLMLMRNERLAELKTSFDPSTGILAIRHGRDVVCQGDLSTNEGRNAVERFLSGFCADEMRGEARMLRTPDDGFRFTDSKVGFVSLLNLASVREVEKVVGRPVDPLRFRANVALEGLEPWAENEWVGRTVQVGECRLTVTALTDRCAATEVDPGTGTRDMAVVKTLVQAFGHNVCGVYASVAQGGLLRDGDAVALA